jgi:cytoskeletal protein CcmA (bactofilin family)
LQVDGGTTLNNQLSVLGPTANVNINQNLRVDGSGSFGNGLDVAGNVVLNVGGAGTVFISGSSRLGDDAQNDSVVISGSFNQIFTGTAQQNLFVRNSAVKSSSITFDDDNSPLISGLPPIAGKIVVRNRSNDGTLDSYLITNVTSSVLSVTNATAAAAGRIGIEYLNTAVGNSIRVNIAATDGEISGSRIGSEYTDLYDYLYGDKLPYYDGNITGSKINVNSYFVSGNTNPYLKYFGFAGNIYDSWTITGSAAPSGSESGSGFDYWNTTVVSSSYSLYDFQHSEYNILLNNILMFLL